MGKVGGGRNFGFGKQMSYAGFNALRESYQGHFGTVAAHAERFGQFAEWCKENGVRDARDVTVDVVKSYGRDLADNVRAGNVSVSYAQNLLSSVNVTMAALRHDSAVRVSPRDAVGVARSSVRTEAPTSLDRAAVSRVADALRGQGHERAASVVELARDLGLRAKEASLLDARAAVQQALERGAINVTEGTKGGRGHEVDRWVPVSAQALASLQRAAEVQGQGRNLIPEDRSWYRFNNHLHAVVTPALEREGLTGIHDMRAAYACERYEELTGHQAPCVAGDREATKAEDREARATIAEELGHGRTDVTAAYVGSAR